MATDKPRKRAVIIQASKDVCFTELNHIESTLQHLNIDVEHFEINDACQLLTGLGYRLDHNPKKFDYVYLCAHGNVESFGDSTGRVSISWRDFGQIMCETECMEPGCIFMLACCRSGLNKVAFDLFWSCPEIQFVCGPNWSLNPIDLTVAFTVFVYNVESRKVEPINACERTSKAVDFKFYFYDRIDVEQWPEYIRHIDKLELENNQSEEVDLTVK